MLTPAEIERGRRRLRDLLPWARAEARKHPFEEMGAPSPLFDAVAPHLTENNLDALVIYETHLGGWHADLYLKRVPPGVPSVIGTPTGKPCPTREMAIEQGKHLLVIICTLCAQEKGPVAPPAFLLYGYVFPLSPELYDKVRELEGRLEGYGTPLQAAARVERTLDELCPEGFDGDAFDGWPIEKKAKLLAVLHRAAISGLYRFPSPKDVAPDSLVPPTGGTSS